MSEAVIERGWDGGRAARAALQTSAVLWFIPACIGQWLFAYYIAVQYIGPALVGNLSGWNDIMVNGLVAGDLIGNIALIIHLFVALVITVGGTLQLIPAIRNRAPVFHRWNGRLYIVIALLTSVAAIYMTWARDQIGNALTSAAITIDGVLIIVFALLTIRAARARRFDEHNRWALRTFIVVSGVWFMRLSYGFLVMLFQGPVPGVVDTLDGPTDLAISFACYLIPLTVLELYFLAKRSDSAAAKWVASGLVLVAAGVTAVGVFGAAMIFWIPRLS